MQNKSLTAIGAPNNFLSGLKFLSKSFAFLRAVSNVSLTSQFNFFDLAERSTYDFAASSQEISFVLI